MIKSVIRSILNKSVNRHRFNDSIIYNCYIQIFKPKYAKLKRIEKEFYRSLLSKSRENIVFDIGANAGSKTKIFLNFVKEVVSVEASPATLSILQQRFIGNHRVHLVGKACGAAEGTAQIHSFGDDDSYNTLSNKWLEELTQSGSIDPNVSPRVIATGIVDNIPVTTLDALIAEYGAPYYIKIDVEGFELEVIKGLSAKIKLISMECNLPTFKQETINIIDILSKRDPSATYNFVTVDPPVTFQANRWLTSEEIVKVGDDARFSYMELYYRASD